MPEYLRHGPHGFCQRCGFKYYLAELAPDAENDKLYVCDACVDMDHPQKYPAILSGDESVLPVVLPPSDCDDAIIPIGQVSELSSLALILPVKTLVTTGVVRVSVGP